MRENINWGKLLHGGDYNPEQWIARPDVLDADIELLKEAGCNTVTIGMFSWSALEPEEGVFEFGWLKQILDNMHQNEMHVILATPSGARPRWLANKYPEVLRVDESRHRDLYGARHNHCYTSPVYRDKVNIINRHLARQFAAHPAVILWHISNEYGGECHCELCQHKFRVWLRTQYNDINELNRQWWTSFWSHTYNSFDDIESPNNLDEGNMQGLHLAWRRFVTEQTVDFMRHEVNSLHSVSPQKPVTTNLMYRYDGLNYHKFRDVSDIISWDNYPTWGKEPYFDTAVDSGFWHDVMRSIKKQPFLLMESCPSATNWQPVSKLKRPGVLKAASLQAVAHGSDSVLYFQVRQSRGGSEKFHGAVIDQSGKNNTRVFREISDTGTSLNSLAAITGAGVNAKAAVVYDWENKWAIELSQGPRNAGMGYSEATLKPYTALRKLGLDVDVVDMEQDISEYELVVAPMLYMFRAGFEDKIRSFVEKGGSFILTYWSGIVNSNDLCFLEGTPHSLTDVFGLERQEIDALYNGDENLFASVKGNSLGINEKYSCQRLCDIISVTEAEVLMKYGKDFYKGTPALTRNTFGKGFAYYVCADADQSFWDDIIARVAECSGLGEITPLAEGLLLNCRQKDGKEYMFLQNFSEKPAPLPKFCKPDNLFIGKSENGMIAPLDTLVFLN